MILHRMIAPLVRGIVALDRADNYWLRLIPSTIKRRLIHGFLKSVPQTDGQMIVEMDGVKFGASGSLSSIMSIMSGNDRLRLHLAHHLRPGMTVVDVGAHFGYISLLAAAAVGVEGRVFAIEPAPDNLAVLRRNIERNHFQQVTVVPYAVGSARQTASFYLRDASQCHGLSQEHFKGKTTKVIQIEVAPLDELVIGPVNLMKIDVEGHEIDVLKGALSILQANPAIHVVFEYIPMLQKQAGHSPDELPLWLLENGFVLRSIEREGERWSDKSDWEEYRLKSSREETLVQNLYAVRGLSTRQ